MDPDRIKLEARLGAIEYMIAELFKVIYEMRGTPLEAIEVAA